MTMTRVRKAIFPVGGLGTRFLPATKAMPKEMLPVVDKPLIQYAVEEARDAGIEEFIFVTGRGKQAIEDHFDHSFELQTMLAGRGKKVELDELHRWMPAPGSTATSAPSPTIFLTVSGVAATRGSEGSDSAPIAIFMLPPIVASHHRSIRRRAK